MQQGEQLVWYQGKEAKNEGWSVLPHAAHSHVLRVQLYSDAYPLQRFKEKLSHCQICLAAMESVMQRLPSTQLLA